MPAASPPGFDVCPDAVLIGEACGPKWREVGESDPVPLVLSATAVRACECKIAPSVPQCVGARWRGKLLHYETAPHAHHNVHTCSFPENDAR